MVIGHAAKATTGANRKAAMNARATRIDLAGTDAAQFALLPVPLPPAFILMPRRKATARQIFRMHPGPWRVVGRELWGHRPAACVLSIERSDLTAVLGGQRDRRLTMASSKLRHCGDGGG